MKKLGSQFRRKGKRIGISNRKGGRKEIRKIEEIRINKKSRKKSK